MSIYKRSSGRWAVLVDLDALASGKRRRRSLGTYATRKEAERAEREALSARDRGIELAPGTVTVAQLFDRYLSQARSRVAPKTLERYQDLTRRHLLPTLGAIAVGKLKPAHLASLYTDLAAHGRANGKGGLSPRTIGHVHTLLHGVLAWAQRMELAGRNVADIATPPKGNRREAKALSIEEAQALLARTQDHRLGPLFTFALATGLRRGEIVALRWEAIDLDAATAAVRLSASYAFGAVSEKTPKSGKSRTVALSPLAVEALRVQKVRQAEHRLAAGGLYLPQGFVFADELGARLHPRAVTSAFTKAAKRLKLSTTSFHSLRHTCATLMIGSGVDVRTAASVLGHASPTVTLSVYAHVIAGAQAAAVATVDYRLKATKSVQ